MVRHVLCLPGAVPAGDAAGAVEGFAPELWDADASVSTRTPGLAWLRPVCRLQPTRATISMAAIATDAALGILTVLCPPDY